MGELVAHLELGNSAKDEDAEETHTTTTRSAVSASLLGRGLIALKFI